MNKEHRLSVVDFFNMFNSPINSPSQDKSSEIDESLYKYYDSPARNLEEWYPYRHKGNEMRSNMIEWNPKIPVIEKLIAALYDLDGCRSGGLCHVVTDDDNIDDDDLEFVIRECHKSENKNRIDVELSSLICELLLQLTFDQRALLFTLLNMDCSNIVEEDWNLFQNEHDMEALVKEFKYEE